MLMTKEELEKYKELLLIRSALDFLKECPMCKNKFKKYFLEKRNICVTCEREQKLNDLGI